MGRDSGYCTGTLRPVPLCKLPQSSDSLPIMIEAGAILFVVVVAMGTYLSSWIAARQFSEANAANHLDVLRQHRETLLQKVQRGVREDWDSEMMRQLEYRLTDVEREIAQSLGQK